MGDATMGLSARRGLLLSFGLLLGLLTTAPAWAQRQAVSPLSMAKVREDADADGHADRLGRTVRLQGRVVLASPFSTQLDNPVYLADATGGLRVEGAVRNTPFREADSLVVEGVLTEEGGRLMLVAERASLVAAGTLPLTPDAMQDDALADQLGRLVTTQGRLVRKARDARGPFLVLSRDAMPLLVRPNFRDDNYETVWKGLELGQTYEVTGVLEQAGTQDHSGLPYLLYTSTSGDLKAVARLQPWMLGVGLALLGLAALVALGGVQVHRRRGRRNASHYRAVVQAMPTPLLLLDAGLHVLDANPSAWRLLARGGVDLRRLRLDEIVQAEGLAPNALWGPLRQAGELRLRAALERAPQEVLDLEVQLKPLSIKGKDYVTANVLDLTEHRESTRFFKQFYQKLLADLPFEVVLMSPQGEYVYLNPAVLESETARQELLGKTDVEYGQALRLHPEVALRRRHHRKRAVAAKEVVTFDESFARVRGQRRHYRRSFCPILDAEGNVSMVLACGVDVTSEEQYRQDAAEARAHAEEMTALKEALLDNLSHEFRTPLTGIIGSAQILADEITPDHREFVEIIERNGRRLMSTLTAILDLAGLHAEALQTSPRVLNLVDEVREVVRTLQPAAEAKNLFLRVSAQEPEVLVRLDQACLYRVLQNLVENAIKFTESGGVVVEVTADVARAHLRVMDTGVGMDRSFINRLFEDFRQESQGLNRSHEGVGLGLAITKRLVDLMRGTLTAESDKGEGSLFTLSLPSAFPLKEGDTPTRRAVLVAESAQEIQTLIQYMLEPHFQVEVAADLASAVQLAGQQNFDAVLLDVAITGGESGNDALGVLRNLYGYQEIPIVALDSNMLPGGEMPFLEAGFDGYLAKPFRKQVLLNLLGALLAQGERAAPQAAPQAAPAEPQPEPSRHP